MKCSHCGKSIQDDAVFCAYCGKEQRPNAGENAAGTPMKRHQFLVRYGLYLSALGYAVSGAGLLLLSVNERHRRVYFEYPGLEARAVIFAILCFGMGAFALYARYGLAYFHKTPYSCLSVI